MVKSLTYATANSEKFYKYLMLRLQSDNKVNQTKQFLHHQKVHHDLINNRLHYIKITSYNYYITVFQYFKI